MPGYKTNLLFMSLMFLMRLNTKEFRETWTIDRYQWLMGSIGFVLFWMAIIPALYEDLGERFIEFTGQKTPAFLSNIWWNSELAFAPTAVIIILSVGSIVSLFVRIKIEDYEDATAVTRKRIWIVTIVIATLVLGPSTYYILFHFIFDF